MALEVADRCPGCGIAILRGAIFDAVSQVETYGPILGLSRDADVAAARAGYVGLGSMFDPVGFRPLYRCPRCGTDTIIESSSVERSA